MRRPPAGIHFAAAAGDQEDRQSQARQIRPARRWVPESLGPGRQIDRRTARKSVSRLGGQTGTQAPDPTPVPPQNREAGPGSLIHILPADYLRVSTLGCWLRVRYRAPWCVRGWLAVGGMGGLRASGSGDGRVGGLHGWGFRGVLQLCLRGGAVSVPEVGRGPGSASCRGVSRAGRLRWPWRGPGGSAAASAVRVRILASRSSRCSRSSRVRADRMPCSMVRMPGSS